MTEEKVSRWAHYKIIKAPRYILLSFIIIITCTFLAFMHQDWSYFSRSGGFIVLFGALLGLRKLLRKGARELDTSNEPLVINKNQFNTKGMFQRVQDLSDSFSQELGIIMVVIGTFINGFGDIVLNVLFPFNT